MDRRERHQAETRAALVDAAYQLFSERGFENVTIEDITDRADVSRRTYFRYFPSKESVIFGDALAVLERLVNAIAALDRLDLPSVVATISQYFEPLQDDERFRLRLALLRDNRELDDAAAGFRSEFRRRLASGLEAREPPLAPLELHLISALVAMLTTTVARTWCDLGFEPDLRDLLRSAASTLADFTSAGHPRDPRATGGVAGASTPSTIPRSPVTSSGS